MRDLFDQATVDLPLPSSGKKGRRPRLITNGNFHHALLYFIKVHGAPKKLVELEDGAPKRKANAHPDEAGAQIRESLINRLQVYVDQHATEQEWTRCLNALARKRADLKKKLSRLAISKDTMSMLESIKEKNGLSWDDLLKDMARKYI